MMIHETRKRSLVKAISYRVIEVLVDTLILSFFVDLQVAFWLAVGLEGMCLLLHYTFERGFDRIQWGRYIE